MKLSSDLIEYIETVIKTGNTVGIDNIIIEPDAVRAINEERTVVIYQSENVPAMPFGSVGLNRIDELLSRLSVAKSRENFTLNVLVGDDSEFARSIVLKADDTRIDYRCANPETINAPKQINDKLMHSVQLSSDVVDMLGKAQGAIRSDHVEFSMVDADVTFSLTDINNDSINYNFPSQVTVMNDDASDSFTHKYPVKIITSLFKQNPTGHFAIGEKGILRIVVNGLDIFVLPQV